jgi:competence transcription factor ComK
VTNTEDSHEAVTSQIENDSQQISNHIIKFNSDNPLNFHFENDIADRQRKQYESEIIGRKTNTNRYNIIIHKIFIFFFHNNSTSIGGVFLRASNLNDTIPYPTLRVIHY